MLYNKILIDLSIYSPFEYVTSSNGESLVVVKKTYPASLQTMTLVMNSILGGGNIEFSCSPIYMNNNDWGPQQFFDNQRTINDWVSTPDTNNRIFTKFTFPKKIGITKAFIVPRAQNDLLPGENTCSDKFVFYKEFTTQSNISSASGLTINYSGTGYQLDIMCYCTDLTIVYETSSDARVGELELYGIN